MAGINDDIYDDIPDDSVDGEDGLPRTAKDHQQKLMEKRRIIEERLAQRQLERDTGDFYFDD